MATLLNMSIRSVLYHGFRSDAISYKEGILSSGLVKAAALMGNFRFPAIQIPAVQKAKSLRSTCSKYINNYSPVAQLIDIIYKSYIIKFRSTERDTLYTVFLGRVHTGPGAGLSDIFSASLNLLTHGGISAFSPHIR